MLMKKAFFLATFAIALVSAALGQFRDTRLNDLFNKKEITIAEAAAAAVLSEALGLDTASLFKSVNPYGSIYDHGMGLWLSRTANYPMADIYRLKNQGHGWGVIAQRIGMHPGTFNKMRKAGAFDPGGFWPWIVGDRYGLDRRTWDEAVRRGASPDKVLVAAALSRGNRAKFDSNLRATPGKPPMAANPGMAPGKGKGGGKPPMTANPGVSPGQGKSKGKGPR